MQIAIEALSLGNPLSTGKDVVRPVAGRAFLRDHLPKNTS
jgi:hypothetical protein